MKYPPGFRARRGLNWSILGLTYASYYVCRYNFRFATPGMEKEFGFDEVQITGILSAWSIAYGFGQLLNGLLADRIGGRASMLIGAIGTILINLIYGFASFAGTFSTFALIWLINGYFQSFGAPGMIKINAAWFNRSERGTFAGIFGLMIQLGQIAINLLGPVLLAGFTVATWTVAQGEWRWLFRIPPLITALMAVLVGFIPKETPDEAGYPGLIHDELTTDASARTSIKESFITVFKHPLVWWYALAYACTGSVRYSSDQLSVLYFEKQLGLVMADKPRAVFWTLGWGVPLAAVVGSFISGWVSDKFFKGHRSPVAMGLYFGQSVLIGICAIVINSGAVGPTPAGVLLGCIFLGLISLLVNSTHSLVGAAAPMDIGGKKMAGFASGVIDSFQYFGAAITLPVTGWLLKEFDWGTWYPSMAFFGIVGGCAMLLVMRKQRLIAQKT